LAKKLNGENLQVFKARSLEGKNLKNWEGHEIHST
jgi:hypothetical protein